MSTTNGIKADEKVKPQDESKASEECLLSLDELEAKHHVTPWQSAALNRLMNWEEGKRVTDQEYLNALEELTNRKIGG